MVATSATARFCFLKEARPIKKKPGQAVRELFKHGPRFIAFMLVMFLKSRVISVEFDAELPIQCLSSIEHVLASFQIKSGLQRTIPECLSQRLLTLVSNGVATQVQNVHSRA